MAVAVGRCFVVFIATALSNVAQQSFGVLFEHDARYCPDYPFRNVSLPWDVRVEASRITIVYTVIQCIFRASTTILVQYNDKTPLKVE